MTDVITRHGRNGAVLFVSPAAETLFGAKVSELHGHHLFDRVHVTDRPAYLTALADAAAWARRVRWNSGCGAMRRHMTASRPANRNSRRNSSGSRCAAGGSIAPAARPASPRWSR